jgi:hypothetical protein
MSHPSNPKNSFAIVGKAIVRCSPTYQCIENNGERSACKAFFARGVALQPAVSRLASWRRPPPPRSCVIAAKLEPHPAEQPKKAIVSIMLLLRVESIATQDQLFLPGTDAARRPNGESPEKMPRAMPGIAKCHP